MKTIKSLIAVSALATITSAANAMVWDITMTENTFLAAVNGPLIMNFSGTYNDAASWVDSNGVTRQGVADVAGQIEVPGFLTTVSYASVLFDMDFTTGVGYLNSPDASASNCTANTVSGCAGVSPVLMANLYNDINFSFSNESWGKNNTSTGTPFYPDAGVYTWTAVAAVPVAGKVELYELPFIVTLSGNDDTWTPPTASVPEPNSIALLMTGLIGVLVTRYGKPRS